jgi:hypothetical protein
LSPTHPDLTSSKYFGRRPNLRSKKLSVKTEEFLEKMRLIWATSRFSIKPEKCSVSKLSDIKVTEKFSSVIIYTEKAI